MQKLVMTGAPKPIAVYVTVQPTKKNGIHEAFTSRVGVCNKEEDVAGLIAEDKKAMGNTFGGLIEGTSLEGRSYRAFKAVWTELKI